MHIDWNFSIGVEIVAKNAVARKMTKKISVPLNFQICCEELRFQVMKNSFFRWMLNLTTAQDTKG